MPKFDTYRKFQYTAKLYSYTVTSGSTPSSQSTNYTLDGPINISVIQNILGKLAIVFKEGDGHRLQQSSQLIQVTDVRGNEIYPGGIWTLQGVVPIINMQGYREGFKGDAKLTGITGGAAL